MDGKWTRLVPSATLHVDCSSVSKAKYQFSSHLSCRLLPEAHFYSPSLVQSESVQSVARAGLGSVVALEVTTLAKCSAGLVAGGWSTLITALTALIGHL